MIFIFFILILLELDEHGNLVKRVRKKGERDDDEESIYDYVSPNPIFHKHFLRKSHFCQLFFQLTVMAAHKWPVLNFILFTPFYFS